MSKTTEIRFYHLQRQTLKQALPQLLNKALGAGHKIIVKLNTADTVEDMNQHLWTFHPDRFLPHGSKKDGFAADQPIWLTPDNDNPNQANVLITGEGAVPESPENFTLCCEFLNGFDEDEVNAARQRWKTYKDQGFEITYWQQDDKGAWAQKA